MQKLNFIFSTFSANHYHRHQRSVKQLTKQSIKSVTAKAAAVAILAAAVHLPAAAQTCNTFQNADAANPILSVLPAGSFVLAVNFTDIDGDGDLDCYVSTNNDYTPVLYLNKGNAHHPLYQKSTQSGFHKKDLIYSQNFIQFVDIDGDGDMDCFASDVETGGYYYEHIRFFQNIGTPQPPDFVENNTDNPVGNIKAGNYVAFQFADIDGDGDYDLYYYDHSPYFSQPSYDAIVLNTGTKTNPVFIKYVSYKKNLTYRKDRVYYDWNKDRLLDYFSSIEDYSVRKDLATRYYRNTGPKNNPKYVNDTLNRPSFTNGGPYQIVDLNGDGAPEVFTFDGHYSTPAPVAAIGDSTVVQNGVATRVLYSRYRSPLYQYQWELNGKRIPGATNYYIRITGTGTYSLSVTSACGTGVSLYHTVTDAVIAAQEKRSGLTAPSVAAVTVYPNPFVSGFRVQLPGAAGVKSIVRITDLAGREMLSATATGGALTTGATLPKGVYLLQVWQNGVVVYTAKLVKG